MAYINITKLKSVPKLPTIKKKHSTRPLLNHKPSVQKKNVKSNQTDLRSNVSIAAVRQWHLMKHIQSGRRTTSV